MMKIKIGLLALAALTSLAPAAVAQTYYRHYPQTQAPVNYGSNWEAGVIARATERAQNEPGITNELAPDSRQTATGGPVGGVPGYDGM